MTSVSAGDIILTTELFVKVREQTRVIEKSLNFVETPLVFRGRKVVQSDTSTDETQSLKKATRTGALLRY